MGKEVIGVGWEGLEKGLQRLELEASKLRDIKRWQGGQGRVVVVPKRLWRECDNKKLMGDGNGQYVLGGEAITG